MDALLQAKAAQLAQEIAGEATTWEDLNGLMQQMMKSVLETMLDTETDVHPTPHQIVTGGSFHGGPFIFDASWR